MHFDQNKTIGALGTLVVAMWYRVQHPRQLLISLDSPETRRWMNLDDDLKRADLLGLAFENGLPVIDILECKAGVEDARHVYTVGGDGKITGKPVDQLLNTGKSVAAIFGLNELKDYILTPPRREILRNHLYRQGLARQRSPEEKQFWSKSLNSLFSGEVKPTIRLNLVLVNLGLNDEPSDVMMQAEDVRIRVVHLNEKVVNIHLGGTDSASDGEVAGLTDENLHQEQYHDNVERVCAEHHGQEPPPNQVALNTSPDLGEQIRITCGKIKAACQDFGITVTEIDPEQVDVGPSVLRYKIKLAPGEDSARLRKQAENIARQLAATYIPIIGFLSGTHFEYMDLPRPDRQVVPFEPLLVRAKRGDLNELPIHVGVNPAGVPTKLDLGDDKLPHILVAGGTGSGKTIFLYSVVLSLVSAHTDRTLELAIIDPKQTDFPIFGRLKHLRGGKIVTDAEEGVEMVTEIAEQEMQKRSDRLQKAKFRDIKAYNSSNSKKPMRPLVVIIDEYADLVSVLAKKEREQFERVISRITARGRNVGIHLVLATQRPTADIVTGNIKANMACRISFSLPSSRDSQVVLDEPGAERLLRNGDMLLLLEGKLTRLQGYYVDPSKIESLL